MTNHPITTLYCFSMIFHFTVQFARSAAEAEGTRATLEAVHCVAGNRRPRRSTTMRPPELSLPRPGLRPCRAEPGSYRRHGGSWRTRRTAGNPPAAQSHDAPAPAGVSRAQPRTQTYLKRQRYVTHHTGTKKARSPITEEGRPRETAALRCADHPISCGSTGGIVINESKSRVLANARGRF